MKKSYLMIAAAAFLAACSNDALVENTTPQAQTTPLSFSAYAGKITKGTNSSNLYDFYTVFGVYGFKNVNRDGEATDETVFENVPNEYFAEDGYGTVVYPEAGSAYASSEWVKNASDFSAGWYYQNVRYWDKLANSYTFYAIAPYDASEEPEYTVAAGDDNIQIKDEDDPYDISTEKNLAIPVNNNGLTTPNKNLTYSGFNKDYMIAGKVTRPETADGALTTGQVNLLFSHILAKLNVKIELAGAYIGNQELKINELEIAGLAKVGYYDGSDWTIGDDTYSRDIKKDYSLTATTNYSGNYWLETLMFPQTATCQVEGAQSTASDLDDMYIYIKYQIGSETFEAYYDFANVWGADLDDETTDVTDVFTFEKGNEYTLTLNVGPEPIHFDATVTKWADTEHPYVANLDV